MKLSLFHFGSSLCLAGRSFLRQAIHLERSVSHLQLVVSLCARSVTIWVVNKGRYVRAWGALVRKGNVQRRTKESVPVFNKPELSTDRIVKDVLRIIYVYAATVDGLKFADSSFHSPFCRIFIS